MFSSNTAIAILALASISFAQTSTVNLYIPGADTQSLIGEVVGTASSVTTYALQCVTEGEECGFRGQFTITENAATAKYTMPAETGEDGVLAFTGRIDCSLDSTISAVCVESFGGSDANFPGQSTETYTGTDFQYMPVFITAGAAAGMGSTAASTTSSAGSSSQTEASSGGGSSETVRQTATSMGASSSQTATSTSTAGVPVVTGNKGWVFGGAAVVGAMALMG